MQELDLYQSMGFGWIRLDFDWHSIQDRRGRYSWTATDRVVQAARERGLRVLAMPAYTPRWAAVVDDPHSRPADMSAFARFVGAAVKRYRPLGIHDWEIWNEPNSRLFWLPRPDARAYARMLALTSRRIRVNDPEATIIAGALAPASTARNGSQISPIDFLRELYSADASPEFDALSVHPYTYPLRPDHPDSAWNTNFNLAKLYAEMARRGDPKPIWITEFGAPTGTDLMAVSDRRQARILTSAVQDHPPWVERVFLYGGRDRGLNTSDREQNFGFVREDFSDKPSRRAVELAISERATHSAMVSARLVYLAPQLT